MTEREAALMGGKLAEEAGNRIASLDREIRHLQQSNRDLNSELSRLEGKLRWAKVDLADCRIRIQELSHENRELRGALDGAVALTGG